MRGFVKNRFIFLTFIVFVFASFSIVSALENLCPGGESQVIMSLYNVNNSHGANWSSSEYSYKICYDKAMGVTYAGANPHSCKSDGSNLVLKISSSINAHAQNASINEYPVPVCYGDLSCVFVNDACPPGRLFIASLSSNNNAHISADGSSPYKVCCSKQSLSPGKLYSYWTNSTGGMITRSYVNNSVNIVMETGVPSGIAKIEIYEDDGLLGTQSIRVGANALTASIGSDGIARARWDITDADMLAGSPNDNNAPLSNPELEFYAIVSGGGVANRTIILTVNTTEGPLSRPNAAVNYPLNEGVYFAGSPVNFSDGSFAERAYNVYWDVDDSSLDSSKRNMSSFSHIYSTPGIKKITLNATNKNGVSGKTTMNIVILNNSFGIQVIPIIETPAINSKVANNVINYGGGHSYVLNVGSDYNLSCLGGRCPSNVEGCPSGYSGECPISIKNDAGMRLNYAPMEFNWTFVEGDIYSSEIGVSKVSGTKTYTSSGMKQIQLRIKSYSNYSGFTSNPFEITGSVVNGNGCSGDGRMWYENGVGFNTSISGNCGGEDRVAGGSDDCCPIGSVCTSSGGSGIKCSASDCVQFASKKGEEYQIRTCDDYNYVSSGKQTQCEADCNYASTSQKQMDAISSSLNYGENIASTSCEWINNSCVVQYSKQIAGFNTPDTEYQCIMEVTKESECVRNEKTIDYIIKRTNKVGNSWVVVADSDSKCEKSGSSRVKCGGSNIVLPFFDNFNFVASILGVLFVYMFISFIKSRNK